MTTQMCDAMRSALAHHTLLTKKRNERASEREEWKIKTMIPKKYLVCFSHFRCTNWIEMFAFCFHVLGVIDARSHVCRLSFPIHMNVERTKTNIPGN